MRTFVKSIVFAVAMLLSVSVWAGNPENAPVCNNVQNAVTLQPTNQVKDVQQTPCVVYVYFCGKYIPLPEYTGTDCDKLTYHAQAIADIYGASLGCD